MAESTLGTLSVGIDGNITALNNSLQEAERKLKLFADNVEDTVKKINSAFTRIQIGNGTKGFSKVIEDFTKLVTALNDIPTKITAIGSKIGPEVDKLVGSLQKIAPELRNTGGAMKVMANGIDKLASSSVQLPTIIQLFKQFNSEMQMLGGAGAGNVQGVNNSFTTLANTLRGQVNGAIRASGNSLSLLKGGMKGAEQGGNSLIQSITGLDIPLNKMVGRIVLVNNIWKMWGATLAAWKAGVQTVIDTSQGLANIQAVTLSYGKDFIDIQKKIQLTLRESIFPAKELTEAYVILGQAGFTSAEATDAFDAVIRLATASMSSLGESANILTTILRTYGLEAKDSVDVTNQLIAATNLSKLSIEGLNTALNFAGPAAAEANMALNETLAALSVMADRGIKASTQGTGLRQVLAALLDPTEEFKEKMLQLGIQLNDVNPLLNNFEDILLTLRDKGFSAADAFQVLELRTAGAMNVMVSGADTYKRMAETIDNSASALTAQLLQQRGLNAELEIFKNKLYEVFLGPKSMGKWLESGIKLMTKLLDIFRSFIDLLRSNEALLGSIYMGLAALGAGMALRGVAHIIGRMAAFKAEVLATAAAVKTLASSQAALNNAPAMVGYRMGGGTGGTAGMAGIPSGGNMDRIKAAFSGMTVAGSLGTMAGQGAALIGATATGLLEVAAVAAGIYATYQLIQTSLEQWRGKVDEVRVAHDEVLKQERELKKIEEEKARISEGAKKRVEDHLAEGNGVDAFIGKVASLLGINVEEQKYIELLKDEYDAVNNLTEARKKELGLIQERDRALLKSNLPDVLAERQALEDNRLKLEGRYDTLKKLADLEMTTSADRSAMLVAQAELEKFLGIEATTTADALFEAQYALEQNTTQQENADKKLQNYVKILQTEITALQRQKDELLSVSDGTDRYAGTILQIDSDMKKWTETLDLANKYLNRLPAAMKAFDDAAKDTTKVLDKEIEEAQKSSDPVGALNAVKQKAENDRIRLAAEGKAIRDEINKLSGLMNPDEISNLLAIQERTPDLGTTALQNLIDKYGNGIVETALFGKNEDGQDKLERFRELFITAKNIAGQISALDPGIAKVTQNIGVTLNNQHEQLTKKLEREQKDLLKTLANSKIALKTSEAEIDQLQMEVNRKSFATDKEFEDATVQLVAKRQAYREKMLAAYTATLDAMRKKEEEWRKAGVEASPNDPKDQNRLAYTNQADELHQVIEGINEELGKLNATSDLSSLDELFDAADRGANRVFQTNKRITKELEAQEKITKKKIKNLELQVDVQEALKDLAVSDQQEQEADNKILDLKREIAQVEYDAAVYSVEQTKIKLDTTNELLRSGKLITAEATNKALLEAQQAEDQLTAARIQTQELNVKLQLLDIEREKVNQINEAWRQTARTINDGFATGLADIVFGDKSANDALNDYVKSIKESFKNVFKETIKSKVTLLDKPFKGNMLELGKSVLTNIGDSFKKAFGIGADAAAGGAEAVATRYEQQAKEAGVTIEGSGSGGRAVPGTRSNGIDWGAAGAGLVSALGPILSEYVFKLEAGAKGLEKSLQTASKVMQGLAGALVAFGPYGALAGAALYAISWILPFLAPDRYREFAKSEKAFMQRALLAAGGDNLLTFVPSNPSDGGRSGSYDNTTLDLENNPYPNNNKNIQKGMGLMMSAIFGTFMFPGMHKFMTEQVGKLLADSMVSLKFKEKLRTSGPVDLDPMVVEMAFRAMETMAMVFNPMGALMARLGVFDNLFKGGELQAVNEYIATTAKEQGVYLTEKPGSRLRFDYDTTQAFSDRLVTKGQVTPENITKITNAMMLMEVVKARAIKSSKAYELGMTQVNSTLAEFLRTNYDLKALDLDSLFGSFGASIGTFDNALAAINQVYARFKEGKVGGFDFEALQGMVEGAVFMFANSFPKGVNVARRALQELNEKGKIELESLNKGIEELLTKVAEDAGKIAQNPIKIVLETGQVDEALNDLNGQVNSFIKDTLSTNVTAILSNAVIRDGFLTPITEGVQDLSQQFYDSQISAEQFGVGLRALFQNNLIPNILNFKDIVKDTFKAFSATMGFPLQTFPALFGSGNSLGYGMSFDSRATKQKGFQETFLGLSAISDEIVGMKNTGSNIDKLTQRLGTSLIPRSMVDSIVDQTYAEVVAVASNKAMKSDTFLKVDDLTVETLKSALEKWIFDHKAFTLQILKKQPTGKVQSVTVYSIDTGEGSPADLNRYSIGVDVLEVGENKARTEEVMLGGTKQGRTEISAATANATEMRNKLLNDFVSNTGISLADLKSTGMSMFGKNLEEMTGDEIYQLLTIDKYREKVDEKVQKVLEDIRKMDKDVRQALRNVAKSITSSEEFGAFYSSLRQSMVEGFVDPAKFEELLNVGLRTLQKTLPSAINVQEIFTKSFKDGNLDVELFSGVLDKELETFKTFGESLKSAVLQAFQSGDMVSSIAVFTKALKKSIGDAVLDGLIEGFVNRIYIDQIFGPFLQGLQTRIGAFTKGQLTIEDVMAFVNRDLPGVTAAIGTAGEAINPIIATLYKLFTDTGLIDAYDSTLDKQSDLIKKQLEVAEKWDAILKQARDVRSQILYGEGSPQQIRQQIADAQKDLAAQMGIFRSTSDSSKRQDAASKGISLIQQLFQLGNSAGEAGLGDYQKTSASFQIFSKALVAMLDEITNAAINGSSQIELLRRQVDLLEIIAKNTSISGGILGSGDPNKTGAQTKVERIVQSIVDAETRKYKDEQDYRLSVEWSKMTQEERDAMEKDWKWQHDLQNAEIDRFIAGIKDQNAEAYKAETEYRKSAAYAAMTPAQKAAWEANVTANHTLLTDIIDGFEQYIDEAEAERKRYRLDEQGEPPPPGPSETEKLTTSTDNLNTTMVEVVKIMKEAYKIKDPTDPNANLTANVGTTASFDSYEALTVAPTDAAVENTTVSMINSLVTRLQELQVSMVERIGALLNTQYVNSMQQLIDNFAYNGTINITVNGELSAANKVYLSTEIERIVVNSVRRGRIGAEVQRKR